MHLTARSTVPFKGIPLLLTSLGILLTGNNAEELGMPPMYITVSSLYKETNSPNYTDRLLQLNWDTTNIINLGLFTEEPVDGIPPEIQIHDPQTLNGFFETNISLENPQFPGGWDYGSDKEVIPGEHCLNFWISSFRRNKIEHLECLKIRPTWMFDNRLSIGHLPLRLLFIPGTHNSGCYKRGKILTKKDISSRYILTQDMDIWSQLVFGIRYFDLRVGFYPIRKNSIVQPCNENCFWVNHDLIKIRPLFPLLHDIKEFLKKAKGEIVILDFHRFPVGFHTRPERHELFAELLEKEFGDLALPYVNASLTLDEIWKLDKRLIISYSDNTTAQEHAWMWPAIRQLWGNKQTVEKLEEYLDICMETDMGSTMWAAMAQLTPGPLDFLTKPHGSLRQMADSVNLNLTRWIKEKWWDKANIVATDFFLGSDVISLAVAANLKKGYSHKMYSLE